MPLTATKIHKKKQRINISNNELKYQKLLLKHRKLQSEYQKYKESHERKVSLLRCQLKHTLKFVGVKLQNLETRLLWYQKQWKNQQSQFAQTPKFNKPQRNKCIQTNVADNNIKTKMNHSSTSKSKSRSKSKSKSNRKQNSKQCLTRSSISLPSNQKPLISPSLSKSFVSTNTHKYNIVIPTPSIMQSKDSLSIPRSPKQKFGINSNSENEMNSSSVLCTKSNTDEIDLQNDMNNISAISSSPLDISNISAQSFLQQPLQDNDGVMNDLKDKVLMDLPKEAVAKHNQLITRLRARLDTMSDILISTREKLHQEFDDMSFPSSVDLDTSTNSLQLQSQFKHLNLKQVFDGSIDLKNESNKDNENQDISENNKQDESMELSTTISTKAASESAGNDHDIKETEKKEDEQQIKKEDKDGKKEDKQNDEKEDDSIGILSDDEIDFKSVVSRVTERMTILGDKLKNRTSSVSSPGSDFEDNCNDI